MRHLILDWALEPEKAGVVGEGLVFGADERRAGSAVTHNYFVQNVGVWGSVGDQARVTNRLTATAALDLDAVRDILDQARIQLGRLPAPIREQVSPMLEEAAREAAKPSPDRSAITGWLRPARDTCVGAAGNLVARGLAAIITLLLG